MGRVVRASLAFALFAVMVGGGTLQAAAADAPRISQEVLKALLGNPEVTILDVRRQSHYDESSQKIKGAVRESEKDISWASKYPKNRMLVLYCA